MTGAAVEIRRLPYPYEAMLAICSDLDETSDRELYYEIMRFLNTTETTSMGPGVGLEVGNSIYFDMPAHEFAYWTTDDTGRAMIRLLIESGHIDCLHSYGDLATSRDHAARALDELTKYDCKLNVWVDHGTARTNFGADIMQGRGDIPGDEAYHADLTLDFGIRFVWRGRVTSVLGQEASPRLRGIWRARHPLASAKTVMREAAKQALARRGNAKYAMHAPNRVLCDATLRDGRPVYEFLRCNPHWAGVSCCETGRDIGQVLTDRRLETLIARQGVCVLYTHLGKVDDPRIPFDHSAVAAFRRLAAAQRDGRILVSTTRRVLGYLRALREVSLEVRHGEDGVEVFLEQNKEAARTYGGLPYADLAGLTIYTEDADRTRVRWKGREVPDIQRNPADGTGRTSVSIRRRNLEFPRL